jgi:hypothetical protein
MNLNNQHTPNSALEVSRVFSEQEAKQEQVLEEKHAQQALDAKWHHESVSLTAKNVNLMEENNKICRQSLRKATIANWIAGISALIAFCSLFVAIYALVTK